MKKVTLLAASVLAATMAAPSANAYTPNAYFGGYMRSGVMHGESAFGSKTMVQQIGRLGNENDTFGEIGLGTDIAKVDDTTWSVFAMLGHGGDGKETDWNTNLSCRQFFVNVEGLLDFDKGANLWVGKRYYKREDVAIADFYYYNVTGTGVGLENLQVGPGKLSVAWTRNDKVQTYDIDKDTKEFLGQYLSNISLQSYKDEKELAEIQAGKDVNWAVDADVVGEKIAIVSKKIKALENKLQRGRVNTFDARYEFPVWDGASLQVGATYLNMENDNHDGSNVLYHVEGIKDDAFNFSLELSQGMLGGFNKTFVQVLAGASAGDAHGGTGAGMYEDQGTGYRLINWGDVHFTQNLGFAHLINVGYSSGMKGYDNKRSLSVVARPYFQLTKMTRILAEAGYYNERTKGNDGDSASTNARKFTLAYAITPDASNFWSRPEIRFYVSNVHVSDNMCIGGGVDLGYRKTSDTMFGAQVEAWW